MFARGNFFALRASWLRKPRKICRPVSWRVAAPMLRIALGIRHSLDSF
jgi:hypothetical protein